MSPWTLVRVETDGLEHADRLRKNDLADAVPGIETMV